MQTQSDRPVTLRQAAEETNTSYHTWWRMCKRGEVPYTRLGTKILIPAHVIRAIQQGQALK